MNEKEKKTVLIKRKSKKKKNILERLKQLEEVNLKKDEIIAGLTNKLENLEEEVNEKLKEACECITGLIAEAEDNDHFDELEGFICPDCDFVGKNMRGLKIHMTRKHLKKLSST